MKKKIKTIVAVAAYNFLKSLKVKEIGDETCLAIWKDIKAFRPISETYDKDVKDVDESLKGDDYDAWEKRRQKAAELEAKVSANEAAYTSSDIKEQNEVIAYLKAIADKKNARIKELNEAEVELDIYPIKEAEMIKAIKLNDQSIGVMDELDFLVEE